MARPHLIKQGDLEEVQAASILAAQALVDQIPLQVALAALADQAALAQSSTLKTSLMHSAVRQVEQDEGDEAVGHSKKRFW